MAACGCLISTRCYWHDDSIQFPRLLAELSAALSFDDDLWNDLTEAMDITDDELNELLDRAQNAWERIKYGTIAR